MLITCVDVKQILPYLTFVEYPQSYRNIANSKSGREAIKTLIEDLQKSKELGRWTQFVEALERCGYEYVIKCLKGQLVKDNSCQKEFLKIMSVVIRKYITPTELTPFLWAHGVINDEDKQRIECQQTAHGEIQAADMLLEIIPTKIENWYRLFVDSLLAAKLTDVAKLLDIPEIMDIPTAGQKSSPGKTELALSKSVPENRCANPEKPIQALENLSTIVYFPEGTNDDDEVYKQGRLSNLQLFETYEEQYEDTNDSVRLETWEIPSSPDHTTTALKLPSLSAETALLDEDFTYSESSKKVQTEITEQNEVNTTFTRQKMPTQVETRKPVRNSSSVQLLKDSPSLKDLAEADCGILSIETERFERAKELLQRELEQLEDIKKLKQDITEMGAKKDSAVYLSDMAIVYEEPKSEED
ncbi:uncharacterized protein LOC128216158 [Mya arenaria]|uniref:uncharacterized protein LOC128216158 n=1 Tax=Mya arenaria TaxID=6604 RepID=UPI0022E7741F|nr:uncharacterized protein LOC128216158 [Mya arenaria]